MGWSRSSYVLIGGVAVTLLAIVCAWWPLVEDYLSLLQWRGAWWWRVDWLLIAILLFMCLLIMSHANLKRDAEILFVGFCGGFVIETWGTQTGLWSYYTNEQPPLWILPAWPMASLTIDRIVQASIAAPHGHGQPPPEPPHWAWRLVYWALVPTYLVTFASYAAIAFDDPLTVIIFGLVIFLTLTPSDPRKATITFLCGSAFGTSLELWGTTRGCWSYYTGEAPPLFAVLSHGMAAVVFQRASLRLKRRRLALHPTPAQDNPARPA